MSSTKEGRVVILEIKEREGGYNLEVDDWLWQLAAQD